jgi:hypothetical protein
MRTASGTCQLLLMRSEGLASRERFALGTSLARKYKRFGWRGSEQEIDLTMIAHNLSIGLLLAD